MLAQSSMAQLSDSYRDRQSASPSASTDHARERAIILGLRLTCARVVYEIFAASTDGRFGLTSAAAIVYKPAAFSLT